MRTRRRRSLVLVSTSMVFWDSIQKAVKLDPLLEKNSMKEKIRSKMFVAAAACNMIVAVIMALFPSKNEKPSGQELLYTHIIAFIVAAFGVGYYWASQDYQAHANIIRLGCATKLGVATICFMHALAGTIAWQDTLLAVPDVGFALLFYFALAGAADVATKKHS